MFDYVDYASAYYLKWITYRKETVQVLEDGRIPCASDEIFVRSYENLLPASDGKNLVVLTSN